MSRGSCRIVVFCCARSDLTRQPLPEYIELVELPCTGRVSIPLLLATIAQGAKGVLVLGRHRKTCRLGSAEEHAEHRAHRASELIAHGGLSPRRILFAEADPGPGGPRDRVLRYAAEMGSLAEGTEERAGLPSALLGREGLDEAMGLAHWISNNAPDRSAPMQRREALGRFCVAHGLSMAMPGGVVLRADPIPRLALAGGSLFRPHDLPSLLAAGTAVLARFGFHAGIGSDDEDDSCQAFSLASVAGEPSSFDQLLVQRAKELPRPTKRVAVAYDGSPQRAELIAALGHQPVAVAGLVDPARFALAQVETASARAVLLAAEAAGAQALLVSGPVALCRWAGLTRHGSWQRGLIMPVLGVQLAQLALLGLPLSSHVVAGPMAHPGQAVEARI